VGFAEEKIEHFAKLKQKEAKDTLEREKQVRLEKRSNKKKHNKENAKKHHPAREVQMFYRMMLMIPKTPLPEGLCTVKFSTVSPLLSAWVKCKVCDHWACSHCAHLGKKRVFVCDSCK